MSSRSATRVILIGVGIAASIYLLFRIREVIGLVFISVFLAIALGPAVDWLDRFMLRGFGIAIVYVGLLVAIFGIGLVLVPPVVDGIEQLAKDAPSYLDDIRDSDTLRQYDDKYSITEKLEDQAEKLPAELGSAAGELQSVTVGVFAGLVKLITVLVMTAFLLADGKRMWEWIEAQLTGERAKRFQAVGRDIYRAVGGYVIGNFAISFIAGMLTYIALTALGVPFAVPLAVLVAFLDLIPLVGATIGGIIVGLVILATEGLADALIYTVILIVYQQLESHILQPFIYGKTVQLHPLLVIIAILIGATLLGILGALVAIPVAAAVQIVVKDWWKYRPKPEVLSAQVIGGDSANAQ
ncbi:MAG: AI-2E family transporter [Thermoleophilaceae bacterium]|nr:AI-2E family transporter [Thermoleophilaceae bacterium]